LRQVKFTLPELDEWFVATSSILEQPGAVFIDLDERANRVVIGVEDGSMLQRARLLARDMGVPEGAVQVVVTEPIYPMINLQDFHGLTPRVGGLQIHFSNFRCTLGFNAKTTATSGQSQIFPQGNNGKGGGKGGGTGTESGQDSFITASHCTDAQGGVEDTRYGQPTLANPIGTEVDDPEYGNWRRVEGCPRGGKCRWSDAARAAYDVAGVTGRLGEIAKPAGNPNSGSIAWNGTSHFRITGEGAAIVGNTVNKVGLRTGWTQGDVTRIDVDVRVFGTNIVLFDQTFVEGPGGAQVVDAGDSGSSTFMTTGSGDNVTLVGLLWGGNGSGTEFIYSTIGSIQNELGPLTTF
jgi:hypothetical protein